MVGRRRRLVFGNVIFQAFGDLARLKDLRATLRDRIGASPLCDGPSFANNMEKAFQDMWDSRLPDG